MNAIGIILLVVGIVVYSGVAWVASKKSAPLTLIGVLVGVFLGFLISQLAAAVTGNGVSPSFVFKPEGAVNYIVIIISTLATAGILYGLLGWLSSNSETSPTVKREVEKQKFNFATRPAVREPAKPMVIANRTVVKPGAPPVSPSGVLAPPEGFVPVLPTEGVFGMVAIPASVITDSIPEAAKYLEGMTTVRVRLALFVPQLKKATVWLTWRQVAMQNDSDRATENDRPDADILNRWVRVPPQAYVAQVPIEYFKVTAIPPVWMKQTPVAQEEQFPLTEGPL